MSAQSFLADLRREIETHPAVNHLFLNRLATSPFARQDYRVFAENHYPLVCVFTHYLERLLVRAPDSQAKLWLAKCWWMNTARAPRAKITPRCTRAI